MRGDMNCDGQVLPPDALDLVVYASGKPVQHASCPAVGGQAITIGGGSPFYWGDIDCDGDVDLDDMLAHLAAQTGTPIPNQLNCTPFDNLGDVVPSP